MAERIYDSINEGLKVKCDHSNKSEIKLLFSYVKSVFKKICDNANMIYICTYLMTLVTEFDLLRPVILHHVNVNDIDQKCAFTY